MVHQTAAVVWRTLVVQCIKRRYVSSLLELLSVVVLAIAFLSSNFGSRPGLKEIYLNEMALRAPDETRQRPIYYAPKTEYTELLMNASFGDRDLQGFLKEEELLDKCESTGVDLCVYFSQSGRGGDGSPSLAYKLHFFESEPPLKDAFGVDFRYPKEFYYEQEYEKPQFGAAFQAQRQINTAHLNLRDNSGEDANITTRRIPMPRFPANIEHYRVGFFWFLVVSFLYPTVKQICRICSERTSGLMEYQRLMGLTDGAFWAGHFACGFSFCLVHSAVCVYFGTLTRQPVTGVAFLDSTDASLLYAVMLVHSALQMLTAMLIACACPSVWPALLCAVFVCLLLPSLAFLSLTGYGSLAEFVFQDRAVILLSSLLPSMATYNVLTILGIQNDFDGSAGWKNIADLALGVYAVTIADIWMVNFLTVVAMLVLIFYLSNVLPWNSPIPLHPLYFLRPSYWQANPTVRVPPYIPLDYSDKRFEPAPWLLRPVVHIEDVTMVYGSTHALRRVSLQAYEQEATAVVGRNGAGKTTLMNIVAGLVKPTVGSVFVRGYDMVKYTRLARGSVSHCPQRDLLFPDMTVWEHLLFFGAIKEMRPREIQAAAVASLDRINLGRKARELIDQLSRGEKKRLSIAIATIAEPKLLIVDEPTSGLDPNSARSIWDLLLGVRISSTLLFSTHDMAEADVLADRVIALSSGTIVCNASPLYLKSTYGVGYKIHLTKLPPPAEFSAERLLNAVQRRAPAAEMIENSARSATLALYTVSPNGLDQLFLDLETRCASLGIASIGLTVCTLKDIYLSCTALQQNEVY
ncbi:phospholipid-transporting ATPase ABCA3-like [Amblyomma americanum]